MSLPAGITATSDLPAEIEARDAIIAKLTSELAACRAREAVTEGVSQRYADLALRLTKDRMRLEWLGMHLAGEKWADVLPSIRPCNADGESTEKYISGPTMLRYAIDAAMENACLF